MCQNQSADCLVAKKGLVRFIIHCFVLTCMYIWDVFNVYIWIWPNNIYELHAMTSRWEADCSSSGWICRELSLRWSRANPSELEPFARYAGVGVKLEPSVGHLRCQAGVVVGLRGQQTSENINTCRQRNVKLFQTAHFKLQGHIVKNQLQNLSFYFLPPPKC